MQLAFLLQAQAFRVDQVSMEEQGCSNVHTQIQYTGEWVPAEWSGCSQTCGGGVQTSLSACRKDGVDVPSHLCEGAPPTFEQPCGVDPCPCVLEPDDSYWFVPPHTIIEVGGYAEFDCDQIPQYMITETARFECDAHGQLIEVRRCACATIGRLYKAYQVNFGAQETWGNNHWFEIIDVDDSEEGTTLYQAIVNTGPGMDLPFGFRISAKKSDSVLYGVTPLGCMKICLSHNEWARSQTNQPSCTVAVPNEPTEMTKRTICRLRYSRLADAEPWELRDKHKSRQVPYSYDMKCLVDELKEQFPGAAQTPNTVLELLDVPSPEYIAP